MRSLGTSARRSSWIVVLATVCVSSVALATGACSSGDGSSVLGASDAADGAPQQGRGPDASEDGASDPDRCATRVEYGSEWIHGPDHPESFDVTGADVAWDGVCTFDGESSYAVLSNGWKPYFRGRGTCVIALDHTGGACAVGPRCTTRVSYGPTWQRAVNHPTDYDDVDGRVFSDGVCRASGGGAYQLLSNGWVPGFVGAGSCDVSFRYQECGGLYANPVIDVDCPDPGVIRDGDRYVLTCTTGNAPNSFPVMTSPDLVHWTQHGFVFPEGKRPVWAISDFWAPEIHRVGDHYVAYYSALERGGRFRIGAASAPTPTGPFTDLGRPLLSSGTVGLIDASHVEVAGKHYLLWKEDGNAQGRKTPMYIQELAQDGLALVGAPSFLIQNDRAWEGDLVEGPFMIEHEGSFYLFYSANGYTSPSYAVGVARASSPTGPFTKADGPILTSGGGWVGPGHCSVVATKGGDTYMVYHAWKEGRINQSPGRLVLADLFGWVDGWPRLNVGPGSSSRPLP